MIILQRKNFGLISTVKNAFTNKKKFLKSKEKYVDHLKGQFSKDFDKLSPEARKEAYTVSDIGGSSDVKGIAAKHGLDKLDSYKKSEKYNKLLNDKISSINRDRWKLAGGAVVAAGLGYGAKKLYDRYKRKKQEKESKEEEEMRTRPKQFSATKGTTGVGSVNGMQSRFGGMSSMLGTLAGSSLGRSKIVDITKNKKNK